MGNGKVINEGTRIVQNWVRAQQILKAGNPNHRVILDVGMECMSGLCPADQIKKVHGDKVMSPFEQMRKVELSKVWQVMQDGQKRPTGGAGGLGIIGEAIAWTGARFGKEDNFGLFNISLLHTARRVQLFEGGNRQKTQIIETSPQNLEDYLPLGEIVKVTLSGREIPVQAWLFTGFRNGEDFVPAVRLSVPGVTGIIYPHCESQENFDQMQVLGQGGFRAAQYFGLLGIDNPLADLVIGHDGHTALFKFNLFLWFYKKYGDKEVALEATRKLCVTTIHAPQWGTVPRTTGEMVRKHYSKEEEKIYGEFGLDPWKKTNALFADISLSLYRVGVVSSLHLMVTSAEEKAKREGQLEATKLLPDDVHSSKLKIYPDTIDVESWIGMGVMGVLDEYCPEWRTNPARLGESTLIDQIRFNNDFRQALATAFSVQEDHLLGLLNSYFPRKFNTEIPKNAIIYASLRRATTYKIALIIAFLRQYETIENITKDLKRPIFYLFGGLAHQDDSSSIDSLEKLLDLIEEINNRKGLFQADFLINYDLDKAKWIFPGLARRGCWIGSTNPFEHRSQGSEAFGPSYLKAAMNGLYIMGSDDGGAGCLRLLPTVHIYGPTTFAGKVSFHNELWNNKTIVEVSRFLLANGFIRTFEQVAHQIAEDLERFENGQGTQAPGLDAKIISMFKTIAAYNGRVLLKSYLER